VSPRPFRFAVQALNAGSAREWQELCRRTEGLGYSTLFLADHYLGPGPARRAAHTPQQDLAPIAAMATAAAVTETLRVGCRVFCVDYHVPAVLAKETATLDLLSDGRVEVGIGAGWSDGEYGAMGLTFDRPGRRIAKLAEVVALLKAHWSGDELAIDGEHVRVHGYSGTPRPVQRPHPPIMIGGGGVKVLSLAAREADIVSINNVPFVARNDDGLTPLEEAVRRIGYVRAAAPERFGTCDIESSPYFVAVTDDADAALAHIARLVRTDVDVVRDHPNALVGSIDAIVDRLIERRDSTGVCYVSVQQPELDAFAPVVARLTGR
jgi:probable F420-dependent oxidoreductase